MFFRLAVAGVIGMLVGGGYAMAFTGAETLVGRPDIVDGDTLEFREGRVRIYGIDAAEPAQTCRNERGTWACGRAASRALLRMIQGRTVACRGRGVDDYARLIAVCEADGVDIGRKLVTDGLAWAFLRYARIYEREEAEARAARKGVFAAANMPPWQFRAQRWEGARKTAEADRARECPIKGNISRRGDRIYHLPWQASYPRTKINERAGERWFCSTVEAEKAGWRAAR